LFLNPRLAFTGHVTTGGTPDESKPLFLAFVLTFLAWHKGYIRVDYLVYRIREHVESCSLSFAIVLRSTLLSEIMDIVRVLRTNFHDSPNACAFRE
jgi:hypothetical protein